MKIQNWSRLLQIIPEKISEDVLAHDILVHQGSGGTAVEDVNGLAFGISIAVV